mgnify:CR=1 FL=1
MKPNRPTDLGLSYEAAMHGMQSAVAFEMNLPGRRSATEPKHLRVGVNSAMIDSATLARLLIAKGLFTAEEYAEALRLEANNELARYEALYPRMKFR